MQLLEFSLLDDFVNLFDSDSEPRSIHIEIRASGQIDPVQMQAAFAAVVALQPLLRAQRMPSKPWKIRHQWQILPTLAVPAIPVVDVARPEQLTQLRNQWSSMRLNLAEPPPVKIVIGRHPEGDYLILNIHHGVMDGVSSYLLLRALINQYGGHSHDPGFLEDSQRADRRDLSRFAGAQSLKNALQHLKVAADIARRSALAPISVVKVNGINDPLQGFGVCTFGLDNRVLKQLEAQQQWVAGASLNDVLVAYLILSVRQWNGLHGGAHGQMSIMVPGNIRPAGWRDQVMGNFASALLVKVAEAPQELGFIPTLTAVVQQTRWQKDHDAAGVLMDVLRMGQFLPVGLRQYFRYLPALSGHRLTDTTMLTNMGKLPPFRAMGSAGTVTEINGSPPSLMPLGVGVGAGSLNGKLFFGARWQLMQFDQAAGEAFTHLYRDTLLDACA